MELNLHCTKQRVMQILTAAKLTEIFVETDDFLKELQTMLAAERLPKPQWHSCFSRSEVITTWVAYHHSGRKCFKYFYCQDILGPY